MKLALVRHAITAWNLEKRVQGRIDQPLDEAGRQQFRSLAIPPHYRSFRWYCSPLCRATESAQLLGLADVTLETALLEMHWGDWEGEILKPLRKRLGDVMRDNESRGSIFALPEEKARAMFRPVCNPGCRISPRSVRIQRRWSTRASSAVFMR